MCVLEVADEMVLGSGYVMFGENDRFALRSRCFSFLKQRRLLVLKFCDTVSLVFPSNVGSDGITSLIYSTVHSDVFGRYKA